MFPRRSITIYKGQFIDIFLSLLTGKWIEGNFVDEFEKKFARYIGVKFANSVSSGRVGLKIILEALSLDNGSEIVIPAFTDESVLQTIVECGFMPVFVDVNPIDYNINIQKIEESITVRTKVIIATHLFGRPCDIESILSISKKYDLIVLEDCAHSIGALYKSRKVGSFGRASYFSFATVKHFNTFGGGMIATNDPLLADKIKKRIKYLPSITRIDLIKNICISYFLYFVTRPLFFSLFVFPCLIILKVIGINLSTVYSMTIKKMFIGKKSITKLSNLQALFGLKQIGIVDINNRKRIENSALIDDFCDSDNRGYYKLQVNVSPVAYSYVVRSKDKKRLMWRLLINGIDTNENLARYCPFLYGEKRVYPEALKAFNEVLGMPNYPSLSRNNLIYIAKKLKIAVVLSAYKDAR
ncbi:MAG: aminotransferase class I/II-fold pyridoxal phosphate-dependent enzyme [Candidatus Omnitrophota bacterium]